MSKPFGSISTQTVATPGNWIKVPYSGPNPATLRMKLDKNVPKWEPPEIHEKPAYFDQDSLGVYAQIRTPKDIEGEFVLSASCNGEWYKVGRITIEKE